MFNILLTLVSQPQLWDLKDPVVERVCGFSVWVSVCVCVCGRKIHSLPSTDTERRGMEMKWHRFLMLRSSLHIEKPGQTYQLINNRTKEYIKYQGSGGVQSSRWGRKIYKDDFTEKAAKAPHPKKHLDFN